MAGGGSKEWAGLLFLLLYSILKVTLHYCAGSIWLVGSVRWLGGYEAGAQKDGVPGWWEEPLSWWAVCPDRRCMCSGGFLPLPSTG